MEMKHSPFNMASFAVNRYLTTVLLGGGGDGQEKGKKKASDGRHDARNPDGFTLI